MGMGVRISLAAMAAALAGGTAGAQGPEWSAQGRLEAGDPQNADERRYDDHPVRLEAGRRYRLTASSEEFDTILQLLPPGGGDPIAENDDSGANLNSRITLTPEQSGEYTLRVLAFSGEGGGAYQLTAGPVPPLPPPNSAPGTPVAASGTWSLWQGDVAPTDPDIDGRHYDDYLVRFEAGQRRLIMVDADAFDPVLEIIPVAGREADPPEVVDVDDDAGVGFNSLLGFSAESSGDYIVRVSALGGEEDGGAYRLWISQ
jgi:hypothetical protein